MGKPKSTVTAGEQESKFYILPYDEQWHTNIRMIDIYEMNSIYAPIIIIMI